MSNLPSSASEAQMIDLFQNFKMPIMGAGGGFASIGAECYHEGTTAPVGWIICDGSVLNIADYRDLAAYYASHYGASNHFGGDGVTTFAVPTREGMPNNEDSVYGESERIVGVWKKTVDGIVKQKPIYTKTFYLDSANNGTKITVDNLDILVDYGGTFFLGNGNQFTIPYGYNGAEDVTLVHTISDNKLTFNASFGMSTVTVSPFYTKTTDSWSLPTPGHSADGNGVFCVKATLSDAHLDSYKIYSPNEHQYGWWQEEVDGVLKQKPAYEKVIVTTMPSSGSTTEVSISSLNVDLLIDVNGTGSADALPFLGYIDNTNGRVSAWGNSTTLFVRNYSHGTSGGKCYLVIYYTKTTDQWQVV